MVKYGKVVLCNLLHFFVEKRGIMLVNILMGGFVL